MPRSDSHTTSAASSKGRIVARPMNPTSSTRTRISTRLQDRGQPLGGGGDLPVVVGGEAVEHSLPAGPTAGRPRTPARPPAETPRSPPATRRCPGRSARPTRIAPVRRRARDSWSSAARSAASARRPARSAAASKAPRTAGRSPACGSGRRATGMRSCVRCHSDRPRGDAQDQPDCHTDHATTAISKQPPVATQQIAGRLHHPRRQRQRLAGLLDRIRAGWARRPSSAAR